MDYVMLTSSLASFVLGMLFRGYLNKKGENLATKEDIAEITDKVEQAKFPHTVRREQTKLNHQLRLAALDQRLKAHQEAYALWWRLMGVVHDKESIDEVIMECQDWWVNNNLYLEAEARQAFSIAYHSASTYCQIYTELREADAIERQRREKVLSESWIASMMQAKQSRKLSNFQVWRRKSISLSIFMIRGLYEGCNLPERDKHRRKHHWAKLM